MRFTRLTGLVVGMAVVSSLAACQLLSGVTDLVIVADDAAPPMNDAGEDSAAPKPDASADAATDELTLTIDRPEAAYLTTAGSIDAVRVGDTVACASTSDRPCIESLKVRVPRGATTIQLDVTAPNSAHFLEPAACKTTPTCAIDVTTGTAIKVRVVRHNYVFVTKSTYPGNFGSLGAADAFCAAAAQEEGLPGTYLAWISDSFENATSPSRLGGANGFIRMDGRPFADTLTSLQAGKVFYPIQLDPSGTAVDPGAQVFTGTSGLGTFIGNACDNWQVRANRYAAVGWAYGGTAQWTYAYRVLDCTSSARLYCFRKDLSEPLTLRAPPATHRTAFLSTPFTPSGGRAALDQRCQNEASAAALTTNGQTYRAWIATSDKGAPEAFNTSAALGGWYRPDGLPIFPDPTLLKNNDNDQIAPEAPLAQRADQSYATDVPTHDTPVWTGMNIGPNTAATGPAFTCNDWTTASSTSYARAGNAGFGNPLTFGSPPSKDTRPIYFGGIDQPCSLPGSVYCLQQ